MNPYEVNLKKLKESKEISDERDLLKLKLVGSFLKITSRMSSEEIILKTGIHKSDLSRIRGASIERYTIDKLINILDKLGFSTTVEVKRKVS